LSKVFVNKGESVDSALKRFKSRVYKDGILADNKKREYYVKPGVARRLKQKEQQRNSKANKPYDNDR